METVADAPDAGTSSRLDLVVVAVGTVLFLAASVALELNERMVEWTRPWERYQLDEIPGVMLFLALALAWFAWRRMREAREEIRRRVAAQSRLAEALAENRRLSLWQVRVQEEERKELARELHDELGQHLNFIKINAVSLRGRSEPDVHDAAVEIIATADHVHATIRDMLRRLRPVGLDELGLEGALAHLVEAWRARNPEVRAELRIDAAATPLRENENIAIYRLVQESLNNVTRHAHARSVAIRLETVRNGTARSNRQGDVVLSIADDGVGARAWDEAGGLGLIGMRERVEGLNGQLAIDAAPGKGFRIRATLPHAGAAA